MTPEQQISFSNIADIAGVNTLASVALLAPAEFYRRVQKELPRHQAQELYAAAQKARDDALVLEKSILTRASPLLPHAVSLGLRQPDASLQEYKAWFGDRADQYASPGDVSSMFSPAAYLVALYREARKLYQEDAIWHIDQRRPDLAELVLSQYNMDTPVSALSLSNEILLSHVRESMKRSAATLSSDVNDNGTDAVMKLLSEHQTSSGTPYHHHHARMRQTRVQKDPAFKQLLAAPEVTKLLSGPSLAGIEYDISPSLYRLLTDEITEENALEKFKEYFGEIPPELLMERTILRDWFGLTNDELWAFLTQAAEGGEDEPPELSPLFLLKLNKAIRLYWATGLSTRVLEDIVNSVNPSQITDATLTLLFQTSQLMQRYGLSHQDALVMAGGLIATTAPAGEVSLFDQIFNSPPLIEGGFTADGTVISLAPEKADENAAVKAVLKRAFHTDDAGLYCLAQLLNAPGDDAPGAQDICLTLDSKTLSQMYALSLWARLHGLTPAELCQLLLMLGLPPQLSSEPVSGWVALLNQLYMTTQWLSARNWRVYDLWLMTRDITDIPASTEILALRDALKELIINYAPLAENAEEAPPAATIKALLAPQVSNTFQLPGEFAGQTLLEWADRAKPGGISLQGLWDDIRQDEGEAPKRVLGFCFSLAQMALIYHGTGITPDAFKLFVEKPLTLIPDAAADAAGALRRSAAVVMALCDFSSWLKTLPEPAGASAALLAGLGRSDNAGVSADVLERATGLSLVVVQQAMKQAKAHGETGAEEYLASYGEIKTVLQWTGLASVFGVMPDSIGLMLTLDYVKPAVDDWSVWKQVADAFAAGLTPQQTKAADDALASGLSAALSGYLLTLDSALEFTKSREGLHQYLLADNLNGSQVITTRLAEAIAALQTFIHRTLSSPENKNSLQRSALGGTFFLDWRQWNARYSTWAASGKLMYYPENYLDPTLRLGQTRMMDEMLQTLGQAQVNTDTVGDAFLGYLTGFEEVANLETISGYHDNLDPAAGKTWFIGRNQAEPREYWWRTVDESKRGPDGKLPANAWTGWEKINCSLQPWANYLRPVIYKSRLYLVWVERQDTSKADNEGNVTPQWRYLLRISGLRYDGSWSTPVMWDVTAKAEKGEWEKAPPGFYVSSWPPLETVLVIFYCKTNPTEEEKQSGLKIFDDMSIERFEGEDNELPKTVALLNDMGQLETGGNTPPPVINQYSGPEVEVEQTLKNPGSLPPDYLQFELGSLSAQIEPKQDDQYYDLTIQVQASVKKATGDSATQLQKTLLEKYPELASIETEVRMLAAGDKALIFYAPTSDVGLTAKLWIIVDSELFREPDILLGRKMGVWATKGLLEEPGGDVKEINLNDKCYFYTEQHFIYEHSYSPMENWIISGLPINLVLNPGLIGPSNWEGCHEESVVPSSLIVSPQICKKDIKVYLDSASQEAETDWNHENDPSWSGNFEVTLPDIPVSSWGAQNEFLHTVKLEIKGVSRNYTLRVYQSKNKDELIPVTLNGTTRSAQFLCFDGKNTRLNTLFARQLTERAAVGIDTILSWETQQIAEPPLDGADSKMDFAGANAIYFWELFYYTPMMVMQRFYQEERWDLAEKWLQYIWNPAGYVVRGEHDERMWNVRPLHEDTSWNDEPLNTYDPDAVAQNDPMHYKVYAFMRLLDIIIARGDAAYRRLERDTLAEAKIWYSRAQSLLGEAPWIQPNAGWLDPDLGTVALETAQMAHMDALSRLCQGLRPAMEEVRAAVAGETRFYPEANDIMLGYWETLRLRMYNLRHNLTLDGQPMNLALYATPADPKALLAAAVAAEAGADSGLPVIEHIPALRFMPLLDSARSMASQLIQFGSSLQQILERQDAEALAALLSIQGAEIAAGSVALHKQTLAELAAEKAPLQRSREAAITRRDHYQRLYDENISAREVAAMNAITSSQSLGAGAKGAFSAGAAIMAMPNIFGLANGGHEPGQIAYAVGYGIEIAADASNIAGSRIVTEEQYRRRREEWDIQRKMAEGEIAVLDAQLEAISVREQSAAMQVKQLEMQQAHAAAQLALLQDKFTGKAMYSWLRSRLATIYYQYYDLTVSRSLMAQKALQWEKNDDAIYLRTGTWSGAWAGLMCGEGLMLNLAQMEDAWMKWQRREKEITRTVSLAAFFDGKLTIEEGGQPTPVSLAEAVKRLIKEEGSVESSGGSLNKVELNDSSDTLAIHFNLADLNISDDYPVPSATRRVRSIAVTLPVLLGPYEDIRATLRTNEVALPAGCNEAAISHALNDNGLFSPDANDARWLPFEGLEVSNDKGMTLSLQNATSDQKALLESLNDVILHIQYTLRT